MFGFIGVLALLAASDQASVLAAGPPTRAGLERRVISLLDYFESGRHAVDEFVQQSDGSGATSGLAEAILGGKRSCVLLDIRFHLEGGRNQVATASGVLIDGGRRVLTAGHSVHGPGDIEIRVRYPTGETRPAYVVSSRYDPFGSPDGDWALLEIPDGPHLPASQLSEVQASQGDMVIVVGYPDEIGVDGSGHMVHATLADGIAVEPLAMLAVIERTAPMSLTPWVGAIPTRGMSGGPVFNTDGALLGVFVSISTSHSGKEVTQSYDVCSVEAVRGTREAMGSLREPAHH